MPTVVLMSSPVHIEFTGDLFGQEDTGFGDEDVYRISSARVVGNVANTYQLTLLKDGNEQFSTTILPGSDATTNIPGNRRFVLSRYTIHVSLVR